MLHLKSKNAIFGFYHESLEELADQLDLSEKDLETFDYHLIIHLSEVLEVMENSNYKYVHISSVSVFDNLEEFFYFSEVVLGNDAHYIIEEENIFSYETYTMGGFWKK